MLRVRKYSFACALLVCGALCVLFFSKHQTLPSSEKPRILYSNQLRDNLHNVFKAAIQRAEKSLHLTIYALTDPEIIQLLQEKAQQGVAVEIHYDPSATEPLPAALNAQPVPLKKGLMHRKILVVDGITSYLGSANFTPTSLKMHDNLVVGLAHTELAHFLQNPKISHFCSQEKELFLLPSHEALVRLATLLENAQKQIRVALFTLTHPRLAEALITAHHKGVDVRVAIDHYTAEGASLKTLEKLQNAGIPLFLSQGAQLFHHKWALIDHALVLGSANWTQAAFTYNHDCLLILKKLKHKEKRQLKKLWEIIQLESILNNK